MKTHLQRADGKPRNVYPAIATATPAQAQHSPLPWHDDADEQGEIYDDAGRCIADNLHPANAAFIVRACNEYEQIKQQLADAIPEDVYLIIKKQRDEEYAKLEADRDSEMIRAEANEAHAQRLADALKAAKKFIAKLEKLDVLPINSDSGLDWDTRFIIREALAQYNEGK